MRTVAHHSMLALVDHAMTAQYAIDESTIRQRIDRWLEAVRAMDLEGVMSIYAPEVVSFDVEPPLRHVGLDAKRKNWAGAFSAYQERGYEMRDLSTVVSHDVAFAYGLVRVSGTLKNGNRSEFWIRWAACLRKIGSDWLIVHDHVSVPFDPGSGQALLNLRP